MMTNIEIKKDASDSFSVENANNSNVKVVTHPLETDVSHKVFFSQFCFIYGELISKGGQIHVINIALLHLIPFGVQLSIYYMRLMKTRSTQLVLVLNFSAMFQFRLGYTVFKILGYLLPPYGHFGPIYS